jgi:CRP-like cAMP-binding protein
MAESRPPLPVRTTSSPMNRTPTDLQTIAAPGQPETVAEFLGATKLFADVPEPVLDTVAARAGSVHLGAGEWLFHEGDPGEAMYVVRAGRLEVVAGDGVVRELGRGAALGELALLTSSPRSLSIRASRDSDLIAIEAADFARLLKESPELSLALNRTLAMQLRSARGTMSDVRPLPVTIALVPLDEGVPVAAIADKLTRALGSRAAVLDGTETAVPVRRTDSVGAYGPLLDQCEAVNDQVVLVTPPPHMDDPWTEFCLQQADRILAVSSGGRAPDQTAERTDLRGCDLVAFDVEVGSGALAAWAELLDPAETHALRSSNWSEGIERMARRLTGRSVGIVLSGGGARAFSHIGVLEELTAAGIVIDRVAGVSMGAYVGAMFAMGMDIDEIDARCYDEWVRRRPLGDYTVPRHSLIRGDRVEAMLHRTFGKAAIEELDRSLFTAYSELRSSQLVVERWGLLWDRVGSSLCMPVLAPPRVRGRELIADGSLIDNLPVGMMASLGEGPIIYACAALGQRLIGNSALMRSRSLHFVAQ